MAISFISEHSVEYVLVPKLVTIMARQFSKVIPLYFLSYREGSTISRKCNPYKTVRILNMFARRPKIDDPEQQSIEIKLNKSLFEVAQISKPMGVPTFAGVPLISSMMNFSLDANCIWFKLSGFNDDVCYEVSLDGEILSQLNQASAVEGPLEENDLTQIVLRDSRPMMWDEAIDNLRAIRRGARPSNTFWFNIGGGYHPFNLLLFD